MRHIIPITLCLSFLSLGSCFAADSQEKLDPLAQDPLTIKKAIALALLYNPELEAFSWQVRAADASVCQESLGPNPVLSFKVEDFGGPSPLNDFESAVSTLAIAQTFELGQKRIKRRELAQQQHSLSVWDYEAKRLEIIALTGSRYIDLLAATEQEILAERALNLATRLKSIIQERVTSGIAPSSEAERIAVKIAADHIALEKAKQEVNTAKVNLAAVWGEDSTNFTLAEHDLSTIKKLPDRPALLALLDKNPILARWTTEIANAQAAVKLAKAQAIPNMTLGAGLRRFNATDENAFVLNLAIPLPIRNRAQGQRQRALHEVKKARALQRHNQAQARALLNTYCNRLKATHHEIDILKTDALHSAEKAYAAAQKAFAEGITDYVNVIDTDRILIATHSQYIKALQNYHKTTLQIEALTGQ